MNFRGMIQYWRRSFLLALCIAGPAFLAVSLGSAVYTDSFLRRSIPAVGTIVNNSLVQGRNADGAISDSYAPVFTFTANDGRSYTVTSNNSSMPAEFAVGQRVRVLYLPGDPAGAKVDSLWQLWGLAVGFAIAGAVTSLTVFGLLFLLRWRRRRTVQAAM